LNECQFECRQEERIRALEGDNRETKIYFKFITEQLAEIKQKLSALPSPEEKKQTWQPIVAELIKIIGTAILILGGIAGVTKLLK
jgi:hypothetical protein